MLFEDFNEDYISVFREVRPFLETEPFRKANFDISRIIAEASLDLEHLSTSFIVDARYFFQARQQIWVWIRLKSLLLTSRLLYPDRSHAKMNDLFQAAAAAAMEMPMLNVMELWNGGKGFAGVFRYQASKGNGPATITWRGNWDLSLEARVIPLWEGVTIKRGLREDLQVVKELLDADVVMKSHGDSIHHLGLVNQAVHPVSLWQIQKETR